MNEIKELKQRITGLEIDVNNLVNIFEAIAQTMQNQNDTPSIQCKDCCIQLDTIQPGSCTENNCPCGLN